MEKIIDYKNSLSDTGFYFYNSGKIQFYSGALGNKVTKNDEVVSLICTRDSNGVFKSYVVNESDYTLTLDYTHTTSGNNSIFALDASGGSMMGFFFDDTVTSSEATSGGKVFEIRVWPNALEEEDIETIITKGEIIIRHVDENGNNIASPESILGADGTSYTTTPKQMSNCRCIQTPSNATGTFIKGTSTEVKYVYRCFAIVNPNTMLLPAQ